MNTINDSAWRPSVELAILPQPLPVEAAPAAGNDRGDDEGFRLFGTDGFTFLDFLDIINPLHHIPVIGTIYRRLTGDEIDPGSRVFGGTLFFGPVGTMASIGDVLIRDATGKDMGQHVMAFFNEDDATRPPEVADAAATVIADVNPRSSYAVAAAEKSEPLDPVTAWAMEENAYRQAIAAKIQASTDVQPEGHESASVSMPIATANADSRQTLITAGLAQPAPAAQSIIRHTRRSAAMYAAANYSHAEQRAEPRKRDEAAEVSSARPPRTSPGTPPGAVAPFGGWFTEAMLKAHEKYQAGAVNAGTRLPTMLDVTH